MGNMMGWPSSMVVLLAEDVDRNQSGEFTIFAQAESSSSRRTWIEMINAIKNMRASMVVLLAEDVDRNESLKAQLTKAQVVLLAEDVDRNALDAGREQIRNRRPPRGGRG